MPFMRVLCLLTLSATASQAANWDLRLLKGKPAAGELISIDDKNVVLKTTDGKQVQAKLSDVLVLQPQPVPALAAEMPCFQVELTDGSVLYCKAEGGFVIAGKQVDLTLLSGQKLQVPLRALSHVLKDAQDAKIRENPKWLAYLKNRRNQDLIAQVRADILDSVAGTFGEGKGTTIDFLHESGKQLSVTLANAKVRGWIFVNKADPNMPATLCKFKDTNRNVLMVQKMELKEGGDFVLLTAGGFRLTYPRALAVQLDFSQGKLTYLSDMKPEVLEQPTSDPLIRYRRDKNLDGRPLQLGSETFPKGLALHAPSVLAYKLGGQYEEFSALLGVDKEAQGTSNVKVTFEADGKELHSVEIKSGMKPVSVRLKVKEVQELRISVRSVGLFSLWDQVDLANAKVNK